MKIELYDELLDSHDDVELKLPLVCDSLPNGGFVIAAKANRSSARGLGIKSQQSRPTSCFLLWFRGKEAAAATYSTGQKQARVPPPPHPRPLTPTPALPLALMNLIHYCITDGTVNMVSLTSFLLNILVNDDSKVINCKRTSPP